MNKYSTLLVPFLIGSGLAQAEGPAHSARTAKAITSAVISLDGDDWLLATDPNSEGRQQNWFCQPRPEARPAKVPWIIQDAFPGYHGVAWYWRKLDAPHNPHAGGRYLLRFWAGDYLLSATSTARPVRSACNTRWTWSITRACSTWPTPTTTRSR